MNILLTAINAKYIHSNPAVFSLRSCTGEYASHVDIIEFTINQSPSYILQEIYKKHPDVIAFSCYIWNRNTMDALIPDLHKILPDTDLWAGGPEVSYNAEEIIQRWQLRGVMSGPGEGAFSHLVSSYVNGTADSLPAVLDGTNTPVLTLDEIPFWYKELENRHSDKKNQSDGKLTDFEHRIIYYESSRGCPFSCSYCLSSIEKTMDFRSLRRVYEELDFFLEKKVPQVKFIDRTFNCKKDHALPILKYILEHDNGITNFHFEIAADLLDEDYLTLLQKMRPGAVQLEIGVQSTCPKTVDEIDRRMDFSKVAAVVRQISSWHNIHIHLDLIAGLPFEDLHTFRTSFNDVYALKPQQLQLGFLKVLKGSPMELRAPQYNLMYTSLPPYEVLSTRWLSYADVCHLKQIEEVLELYYNSGQFMHSLDFLCSYFDTPYDMYDALAVWYEEHDLFGIQSSRVRKYETLLEFGIAYITSNMEPLYHKPDHATEHYENINVADISVANINSADTHHQICSLKEYITYDLYLREHMKNRPGFALSQEKWKDTIHDILHKESETHMLFPELADYNYRELTKILHVEVFEFIFDTPAAVLFCYNRRNPLTNNCDIVKIPEKKTSRTRISERNFL